MATRHTRADGTHDLIGDGADQACPIIGRHLLVALSADQHHLVTHADGVVTHVYDDLVHGDGAGQRVPPPTDEHLAGIGEQAGHPVGIADGHGGNRGLGAKSPTPAVRGP